jgi:tetratricopeptide (TPR) repeat protein
MLEHDSATMDRVVSESAGKEGQWELLDVQALAAASDGMYHHSEDLFHAAYEAAMHENLPIRADGILIDQTFVELDAGMGVVARSTLRRVTQHGSDNPEIPLLLAALGDIAPAQHALAALGSPNGQDTLLTYVYGPCIRAELALRQANQSQAIAELKSTADDDFAAGYTVVFERAEAYLRSHESDQASNEYKKILDHPGIDPVSPLLPLAQLGLARAEAQAGRTSQSMADYEKLFAQWKQADPDLPILIAARREYLSLTGTHAPAEEKR